MHDITPTDAVRADRTGQALDLTELDDQAYARFMGQLLADLAYQRQIARSWRLPTLVMPKPAAAMA